MISIKALKLIEKPTDVIHHLMFEELNIDIDNVDLEDSKTFQLYKNGDTTGTFQFRKRPFFIIILITI